MRIELLNKLARKKIFTIDEAAKITGIDKNALKVLLSRLEKRGWVERIEKGKYIIIPLGAEKGEYTLHEFIIGSLLVKPSAIAYWSALNYHGFTEQIPNTVFVQTTARKKRQDLRIFGVRYKIVRIKPEKFFGIEKVWIEEFQVPITDREKTVVDCLDKPRYCGGIIEVAKAFREELDTEKLREYALRMNNSAVIRRLGYLCDYFGVNIDLPKPKTRNYILLDPTMPREGNVDSKWRVIVNVELEGLE
ncbi:MAG: type IV toxin-antitoxin system AbiEi family antitoxin domain-containing protein [Thermococcus sp.]|uniref:type IV toxin-antitoxin system AbiEi family antitoxin domain-containing protein n=1 Tax=Thermococcus sp. TaxID=35749 RepID=UPI001D4A5742|nr:type IV toxin-antitoxin system AbiEi family antitoxin domain-containing protein [Thermococcus sp.]MBO8175045.1 type IV toxin-antitoxin system AbiEi family antitoxin domain-containing protein [Thermococcus sp.]